jgi:LysM repeat protein
MKVTTCPYLSIQEDPETQLAFPSIRNCCRRARPVMPVNLTHQSTHCLSTNFVNCPVPTHKLDTPLPVELRAEVPSGRKYLLAIGISVIVMLSVIGAGLWKSGFLARSAILLPSVTMGTQLVDDPTGTGGITPTNHITPIPLGTPTTVTVLNTTNISTPSATPSPTMTPANIPSQTSHYTPTIIASVCSSPEGWVGYIVEPNDTLYQIGLDFGVTVAELQKANCLGSSEVIYTGQVIYVPNIPTRTPLIYITRTPTRTASSTRRSEARTKTPTSGPTNTPQPSETQRPSNTPTKKPTTAPVPTETLTPPPLPTFTFTPPPL